MKQLRKYLPLICAGLGIAGMLLRQWLLSTGFDEKGLLQQTHPAQLPILLTAAAAVAVLIAALWGKQETSKGGNLFPGSLWGAAASGASCLGILLSTWDVFRQPQQTMLLRITCLAGTAAFLAGILLTWCRYRGLRPHALLRTAVTLYFMFHLVYYYQQWFSQTQTALYAAQLMAQVLLILASYHRTALETGLGGGKRYLFTSQLAAFFCLLSIPGAEQPVFYIAMAIWLLGDTGELQPQEPEEPHEAA